MQNDYELILYDRIEAIKSINQKYDLENNGYISFSGGKDSTILSYLMDLALPNNKIPRVFINTGIEYTDIVKFVKSIGDKDDRFKLIPPAQPIKYVLEKFGYPFKSKQHSHNVDVFQRQKKLTTTSLKYLGLNGEKPAKYQCPNILKYQFDEDFSLRISDKCCYKLKKEPMEKWKKENNKSINITGMRKEEKGLRNNITCIVTDKDKKVVKFHPLSVVGEDWEEWFIDKYEIKLCKLYYPPYNFKRTGCKGCPFALGLQEELQVLEKYFPNEYKQCEIIWNPIYNEYRRLGYRLLNSRQMNIFDFMEERNES